VFGRLGVWGVWVFGRSPSGRAFRSNTAPQKADAV